MIAELLVEDHGITTPAFGVEASRTHMLLMCPPKLYDVNYVINPWMRGNLGAPNRERAMRQWQRLHDVLSGLARVVLIEPVAGSPDMVFTANAGLARDGVVALSSFFYRERQGEELAFRRWFEEAGYRVVDVARATPFEGEGDALFSADGTRLWVGFGTRTSLESHAALRGLWDAEVCSLRLVDPRFYHLDTCFAPLSDGSVMYFPGAFDAASLAMIEEFYAPEERIAVSEVDALRFACNAVNLDRTIVLNCISDELEMTLRKRGFDVVQVELDEFLKAGGAAKCLVMKLTPALHFVCEEDGVLASSERRGIEPRVRLTASELIAIEDAHGAHNHHPLDVVIERGERGLEQIEAVLREESTVVTGGRRG